MAKSEINTVLFGLDGVIVNTDHDYDMFWNGIAGKNGLTIKDFASVVKGMTLNAIIDLYFAISTIEEKQAIRNASMEMDKAIDYKKIVIPGVLEFISYLKEADYRVGLVTSSPSSKVKVVIDQLSLEGVFDTIITSDSIKKGKPDPMGYMLAKTNLGVQSGECIVFEDSFTGIKAATYAFMRIIGVATSLPVDFLKDYTYGVIKDFSDIGEIKKFLD